MLSLADVGEQWLTDKLARLLSKKWPDLPAGAPSGVGDDAAVYPNFDTTTVMTADMLVEDVDFRHRWASFADIGSKAAAVNLSDLAAMGATPRALMASVAFKAETSAWGVWEMLRTLHKVGCKYGAPLIGGDVSAIAGANVVSITAIGSQRRGWLRRKQAALGDVVCVSGALGAARAGLALLESPQLQPVLSAADRRYCIGRQLRPVAHVRLGQALAQLGCVSAAADVSDGLARDALHLVPPHLGVVLDTHRLPIDRGVRQVAMHAGADALSWALCGGEDFVLVFAVPPAQLRRVLHATTALGHPVVPVGRVVQTSGLTLWPRGQRLRGSAYMHYSAASSSGTAVNKSATRP